ncbi:MAG: SGNH/GDSL hydrolase family protein, partial [Limnohabitans sp.]
ALVSADGIPPAIGIMGDSIAQQNTSVISGTYYTNARGPVMWMLSYLGHPWEFQPSDNYAVAGTTLDVIRANQLPQVLSAHISRRYQRMFISAGTNDTSALRPIADIQADFLALFRALRGAGIIPVHTGIRPRGADAAITAAKQANMRLNEWLYQLSLAGMIEYIPVSEAYADTSTAFGNVVTTLVYDSGSSVLHPNARGAALEGKLMADYYSARGVRPELAFATQQGDAFDRTNNPGGVAFASANPLLIGGTTAPTGMTTSGGTWANVSRTLPNGQTRADRSCALAASTTHYLYDDWTKTGPWLATDLQPGDIIEGRALVILSGAVNVNAVQMRLAENNGGGSLTHYALANSETANLQGDHVLYLRTPRVPVRDYAGSGNASIFARADIVTDAGASGTAIVRAMEVRKVA